jgi:hypothetical protein
MEQIAELVISYAVGLIDPRLLAAAALAAVLLVSGIAARIVEELEARPLMLRRPHHPDAT